MNDRNINLHKVNSTNDDTFIGLKISQKSVDIFIPEFLSFSDLNDKKAFKHDIFLLINSIGLIKSREENKFATSDNIIENNTFNFLSYIWIIRDYINNGFYKEIEKKYSSHHNGKINWKKTLNGEVFFYGNNVFYKNLVSEYKSNIETTLTEAYKVCLYISLNRIGWLLNLSEMLINISFTSFNKIPFFISLIKKEIKRTFIDNKKIRLKEMLKILLSTNNGKNINECIYGTSNYFIVFEKMVDKVFGNVKNINDYYPKGIWFLENRNLKFSSTNLRPDTIATFDDCFCLIDSKYYRFGITFEKRDLPNTTSIEKQIVYAENLKKNHSNKKPIYNIFVMPFNKESNKAKKYFNRDVLENIEYIGYAFASWKNTNNRYLHNENKIFTFLIDLKYLMQLVNLGYKLNFIDSLYKIKVIE